jgi:hypothetical protein
MLYCIWMSCFIYIASLAWQMNFCRDKEIEYRMQYMEYIHQREWSCYQLWASWERWCYDCTWIIYSFFYPWKKKRNIDATYPYYNNWRKISKDELKTWDLVLFIPKEERQWTHTATYKMQVNENDIVIIDAVTKLRHNEERTIPIKWNIYKIVFVRNEYIYWW